MLRIQVRHYANPMKEQQLTTFSNESRRRSILLSRRDMLFSIADSVSSNVSIICRNIICVSTTDWLQFGGNSTGPKAFFLDTGYRASHIFKYLQDSEHCHASCSAIFNSKEAIHIQREQPSLNQQLHQVNLKAGLHGTICRPDGFGAEIVRGFWQPMKDRFMENENWSDSKNLLQCNGFSEVGQTLWMTSSQIKGMRKIVKPWSNGAW